MKVKILTHGSYNFGGEFINQVLPAQQESSGVRIFFPHAMSTGSASRDNWYYYASEVEVIEEGAVASITEPVDLLAATRNFLR